MRYNPPKKWLSMVERSNRIEREEAEHIFVFNWFQVAYPEYGELLIHYPSGGKRPISVARKLKRMGQRKGVSDFFLATPKNGYHGLWFEYKAAPPAKISVSKDQSDWIEMMKQQGFMALVTIGPKAVEKVLEGYLGKPAVGVANYYRRHILTSPPWLMEYFENIVQGEFPQCLV